MLLICASWLERDSIAFPVACHLDLHAPAADRQSCLDAFRKVVTEIGNTLGYVRMVRTAGMRQAATAVQFLPSVLDEDIVSFAEHCRAGTFTGTGGGAAAASGEAAGAAAAAAASGAGTGEGGAGDAGASAGEEAGESADARAAAARTEKPLSDETVEAAETLDQVIRNALDSFGDETNFLQLLVEVRDAQLQWMPALVAGEEGRVVCRASL